jgi:hypothetical protein
MNNSKIVSISEIRKQRTIPCLNSDCVQWPVCQTNIKTTFRIAHRYNHYTSNWSAVRLSLVASIFQTRFSINCTSASGPGVPSTTGTPPGSSFFRSPVTARPPHRQATGRRSQNRQRKQIRHPHDSAAPLVLRIVVVGACAPSLRLSTTHMPRVSSPVLKLWCVR